MHLTVGVFGDKDLAKRLGKQGTINDLAMYNHGSSDGVFTFVAPNSPDNKIQPVLQTLHMMDVPIISGPLTKELGEQMIALDAFGFSQGFLVSPSEDLLKLIKGTGLERFENVEERDLRERLKDVKVDPVKREWLPVDNYFTVKSVGTVVLVVNKGAAVKKHEKLIVQPLGKEVLVKGIQSQDKDIEEVAVGMRAGLNLKGVDAEELKRGFVLCKEASVAKSVKVRFERSRFAKESPEKGAHYYLSIGLQVIAAKTEDVSGDEITFSLEQNAVFYPGQKCMIASTKPVMPRILGCGIVQ